MLSSTKETLMAKPLISFRPRPEDADELRARAARERKTLSQVAAQLVEDHLAAERRTGAQNAA
jgi:hypothetical protein